MGILHPRHHHHRHTNRHRTLPTLIAFTFLIFSTVTMLTCAGSAAVHSEQKSEEKRISESIHGVGVKTTLEKVFAHQKRLSGPGSWPPSCKSKCGWCSPCKPVHVPFQPWLSTPHEYYPEAWRCKCGDKLFMP